MELSFVEADVAATGSSNVMDKVGLWAMTPDSLDAEL
jgi:hypothetical protein